MAIDLVAHMRSFKEYIRQLDGESLTDDERAELHALFVQCSETLQQAKREPLIGEWNGGRP